MSALDLITTASDATFAGRVMMIQFKVAQNVASEDPVTANHTDRINYAAMVIRGEEKPPTGRGARYQQQTRRSVRRSKVTRPRWARTCRTATSSLRWPRSGTRAGLAFAAAV